MKQEVWEVMPTLPLICKVTQTHRLWGFFPFCEERACCCPLKFLSTLHVFLWGPPILSRSLMLINNITLTVLTYADVRWVRDCPNRESPAVITMRAEGLINAFIATVKNTCATFWFCGYVVGSQQCLRYLTFFIWTSILCQKYNHSSLTVARVCSPEWTWLLEVVSWGLGPYWNVDTAGSHQSSQPMQVVSHMSQTWVVLTELLSHSLCLVTHTWRMLNFTHFSNIFLCVPMTFWFLICFLMFYVCMYALSEHWYRVL